MRRWSGEPPRRSAGRGSRFHSIGGRHHFSVPSGTLRLMLDLPTTAPDTAETGRLTDAVGRLLPSLEAFQRFEGPDPAARNRAAWQHLDRALPAQGLGLDAVLDELAEVVIPHGDRTGMPGFTGWVVNAPTTSGTAAALAGIVAGSQRWGVQPFNLLELVGLRWLAELLELP